MSEISLKGRKLRSIGYGKTDVNISFDDDLSPSISIRIDKFEVVHPEIFAQLSQKEKLQFEATLEKFHKTGNCI